MSAIYIVESTFSQRARFATIGVVGRMATRPVAIPEVFTGEGSQSWSDWLDHFDSVAKVNGWNAGNKKKWLRARLTGRAATALRRLPDADKDTFDTIKEALKKGFEPGCKKELYIAEFHSKQKKRTEDWASYAEDLKSLIEKAYPTLQAEAQELLVLNHFLDQIADPQLSFGVRQRAPSTVDAAVATVLELKTYLRPKTVPAMVAPVLPETDEETNDIRPIAGVARRQLATRREDPLQTILERLEKLETHLGSGSRNSRGRGPGFHQKRGRTVTCYHCHEEGHIKRNCPKLQAGSEQGNKKPLGS